MVANYAGRGDMIEFLLAEKHEIEVYKWIESEKAGKDLGNTAVSDWIRKYAASFRENYYKNH